MAAQDGNPGVEISMDFARQLAEMLRWYKGTSHDQPPMRRRQISSGINEQIGKAKANIPSYQTGQVEIWTGTLGAETDASQAVTLLNMCPQQITKGCWCAFIGRHIFECINPARIIRATLTADLAVGGSSSSPNVDSWFDGHDPTDTAVIPTLKIYSSYLQQNTITSTSKVIAMWDDSEQKYFVLDWEGC